jgi:murein DD-endopeptidase MepM/ murein hydrolase activator NlpD
MQSTNTITMYEILRRYMRILAPMTVFLVMINPAAAQTKKIAVSDSVQINIVPKQVEQGDVARIIITCPVTVSAISYEWQDTLVTLSHDEPTIFSAFLPIASKQKAGTASISFMLRHADNTTSMLKTVFEVIAKDFTVQHLTIDESKNTLSKTDLDRHNSERALIIKMFSQSQPQKLWGQSFAEPLQGRLSTPFGVKRFINKQPRNPHSGVDIAAPSGTPVKAAATGVVSLTGEHFFAGKSVYIDHGHDIISMYFHLDSISVQEGQTIAKGDILGRVGATGRATGPHLHWGVRIQNTPIDPFSLLTLFEK